MASGRRVKEVGSREEVYNGLAVRTSGGLERDQIVPKLGPDGRVVKFLSKKRQEIARANFERHQALFRPGAKRKGDREYTPTPRRSHLSGSGPAAEPPKRARSETAPRPTGAGTGTGAKRARVVHTPTPTPRRVQVQQLRTYPPLRPVA